MATHAMAEVSATDEIISLIRTLLLFFILSEMNDFAILFKICLRFFHRPIAHWRVPSV